MGDSNSDLLQTDTDRHRHRPMTITADAQLYMDKLQFLVYII